MLLLSRLQNEKFRKHQLNRLRYYYAIIECDSTATADAVYKVSLNLQHVLESLLVLQNFSIALRNVRSIFFKFWYPENGLFKAVAFSSSTC